MPVFQPFTTSSGRRGRFAMQATIIGMCSRERSYNELGPLVSVIIPTHNRAGWVGEAIGSVLEQTYQPIELIVVDDGSTDHTARVVQALGSALTYLPQPQAGVSAARNRGVAASHGELVAFLDSDDLWQPAK